MKEVLLVKTELLLVSYCCSLGLIIICFLKQVISLGDANIN